MMTPFFDSINAELMEFLPFALVLALLMYAFIFLIWRDAKIQFDRLYTDIYRIVADEHMGYGEKRARLVEFVVPLNRFLHIEYFFDDCVTLYMYVYNVSEAQAVSAVLDAQRQWLLDRPHIS